MCKAVAEFAADDDLVLGGTIPRGLEGGVIAVLQQGAGRVTSPETQCLTRRGEGASPTRG